MKIYNSLTKKKEEFSPLKPGKVSMYHCGPTVYWTQHIGNMRAVVAADIVNRSLTYLGYDVTLVRNYTDVGHLTGDNLGDADSGEDRMTKAAQRDERTPEQIAQKYTDIYEHDRELLNTIKPQHCPAATEHISEMIKMVEILLEKGFAYTTKLAIYFDISKKADYTKLSKQDISKLQSHAGSGDVCDTEKKNQQDFTLWFFKAGTHSNALQTWESPFNSPLVENGRGFPGWHIECSAMARKYLGDTLDIHMGGVEHIPIHHTNEIAQSESTTGKEFSRFWIHNEHLLVNNGKMSKSEGTSYSIADLVERGYSALDLRYFFLQAHYRSKQNFTWEALEASKTALEKIYRHIDALKSTTPIGEINSDFKNEFIESISDDFNISSALAVFQTMIKSDISDADMLATAYDFDRVLGLDLEKHKKLDIEINNEIQELLDERSKARFDKDWEKSDEIRDSLAKKGYKVSDVNGEQNIEKN